MRRDLARMFRMILAGAVSLVACVNLTGCLVAGYSSGSGFWVWPGSILITLVLVLLWFITRR